MGIAKMQQSNRNIWRTANLQTMNSQLRFCCQHGLRELADKLLRPSMGLVRSLEDFGEATRLEMARELNGPCVEKENRNIVDACYLTK